MNAFIWDLDGTLFDSYGVIVRSLCETYAEFGVTAQPEAVRRYVIRRSVGSYLKTMEELTGLPAQQVSARYHEISGARAMEIPLMPHARETLAAIAAAGGVSFVYTHRGRTTRPVLQNLGIEGFFAEIVTAENGFSAKPAPDGVDYLVEKHGLDRAHTFYVGDRTLDMGCAKNANIRGVLYLPEGSACEPDGSESLIVRDLLEVAALAEAAD